jgi:hypothetical protein
MYWGWMDDPMLDLTINGNFKPQFQNIDALGSGFNAYLQYLFRFLYKAFPFSIGWMALVSVLLCLLCLFVILKSYSKDLSKRNLHLLSIIITLILFREIYLYTNINLAAFATLAAILLATGKTVFFFSKRVDNILAVFFFLLGIQARLLAAIYFFLFFLIFIIVNKKDLFQTFLKPIGLFLVSLVFFFISTSFSSSVERDEMAGVDKSFFYYHNMGVPLKPAITEVDKIRNIGLHFWFIADEDIFTESSLLNAIDFDAALRPIERIERKFEIFYQMMIDYQDFDRIYSHRKDLSFWILFNLIIIAYALFKNRNIGINLSIIFIWYLLGLLSGILILYMPARLLFPILSFHYILVLIYVYVNLKIDTFVFLLSAIVLIWYLHLIRTIYLEKTEMLSHNVRIIDDIQSLETSKPIMLDVYAMSILHKSPLENVKVASKALLVTDTYLFSFERDSYNRMFDFCNLQSTNAYLMKMTCLLDEGGFYFVGNKTNLNYRIYLFEKYYKLRINYKKITHYEDYESYMHYNSNENIFLVKRGDALQFNIDDFEDKWLKISNY